MSTPVLDMIFRSGPMGRIIIGLLLILSLVTWAIIFNRFFALGKIRSGNSLFRRKYDGLKRISEIENMEKQIMTAPMAKMGQAGAAEYRRILEDARSHTGVKDWSFFLQNQFMMARDKLESVFIAVIQPFDKGVFLLAMISS
ncbi:MAG: hypothetical protein Q4F84_09000, partial [Fibrobacter sp.]|nr:hypothetical protein [Fibrobacter sp.]